MLLVNQQLGSEDIRFRGSVSELDTLLKFNSPEIKKLVEDLRQASVSLASAGLPDPYVSIAIKVNGVDDFEISSIELRGAGRPGVLDQAYPLTQPDNLGPITSLPLENRTVQALTRCGITAINQIILYSKEEFANLAGIGPSTYLAVVAAIAKVGVCFRGDEELMNNPQHFPIDDMPFSDREVALLKSRGIDNSEKLIELTANELTNMMGWRHRVYSRHFRYIEGYLANSYLCLKGERVNLAKLSAEQ